MTDTQQKAAAKQFVKDWTGHGDEKQETQRFWMALLQKVYGVAEPDKAIEFEVRVKLDHTSFIDGYIKDTHVLIEQKGIDIDLKKGYKQSDGSMLTPFQQARRYAGYLPHNMNPRWIVVCNFKEFHSGATVYNNFPWPTPTDAQKARIEQTAQAILTARAKYPDCSLAVLYDERTMPADLRTAHQQNDKAVMQAYGFWGKLNTETECVAELMKMYQGLTSK